jgi:ribosomal protein S27E
LEITKELKKKLLGANSEEEVKALVGDAVKEEDVTKIWKEIEAHKAAPDLEKVDDEELEAVSGGADRDWLTDGCAATVEPKSWCDSNDSCIWWDVTYDHEPANVICPKCGAFMYVNWVDYDPNPSNDTYHYKCKNCGTEKSY